MPPDQVEKELRDVQTVKDKGPGGHVLTGPIYVEGSSLFIPVHVKGALLEIGDGHAAQGNGEVDITAIETSLIGKLRLTVHKGKTLHWPRAETAAHIITMGCDRDLNAATHIAVREMIDYLMSEKKMSKADASVCMPYSPSVSL